MMNRLKYGKFYAVLALQQNRHVGIAKHSRAISLFNREFIKTGIIDKEFSEFLPRAFELCQKVDYMEQTVVTLQDIEDIKPKA